jgi:tRNA-2-methylthio-N6-dimethylallyladenosine synthase
MKVDDRRRQNRYGNAISPRSRNLTSSSSPKTYHVKSFGCQMNVYDSERMGDLLSADGLIAVDTPEAADVVVLNTCHIRERAAEKLYSDIGRLRVPRADGNRPTIVAAGCVAQAEGAEIGRRAPDVDVIVGPLAYHRLPDLLKQAATGRAVDIDMPAVPKFDSLPQRRIAQASAFLTVQEGCDKFCTFCVVPYTRGPETSRPAADLIAEAEALVARGVREITLLGQNVNAYNGGLSLSGLIRALADIDGLERIRYTTSHPRDMHDDLIAAHVEVAKLMPYLHLPVQSGSSRILKAMNRAHTRESYLATLATLRAARPDIALSGDFIVGFPGETEADFEDTLSIVREVRYAAAYSFKYSIRPGTPAATMADQVPEAVKEERYARIMEVTERISAAKLAAKVGRTLPVIIDEVGEADEDGDIGATGRSQADAPEIDGAVYLRDVPGTLRPGDIVQATIEDADAHDLFGAIAR